MILTDTNVLQELEKRIKERRKETNFNKRFLSRLECPKKYGHILSVHGLRNDGRMVRFILITLTMQCRIIGEYIKFDLKKSKILEIRELKENEAFKTYE